MVSILILLSFVFFCFFSLTFGFTGCVFVSLLSFAGGAVISFFFLACSVKASTFDFFIRLPVIENGGINFFFGL